MAGKKETPIRTKYPSIVDASRVGQYPALSFAGGGLVYDDVLEYRVWVHPKRGDDYYHAFASFAKANSFSKKTKGAESPCALVLQREWIDEPAPGVRELKKGQRITEWRVEWLAANKRTPKLAAGLMQARKAA